MNYLLLILFSFFVYPNTGNHYPDGLLMSEQQRIPQFPVIDKMKKHQKKVIFSLRDMEISYIVLETNSDVLLDKDARLAYVSDKRMLIINPRRGDVYIFDMNGKALSHFNNHGGNGYAYLNFIAYDEKNKEVFIADYDDFRRIYVYSENGVLKRVFHLPLNIRIKEIYNFDDQTLFAIHNNANGKVTQKQPYMFLSKKDGSIISKLHITTNKVHPEIYVFEDTPERISTMSLPVQGDNCKFGDDFIIADISLDTVYLLKKDKTLTPLFVQHPSVFAGSPRVAMVKMKTDRYIFFNIYSWDLRKIHEQKLEFRLANLTYDFQTGEFSEYEGIGIGLTKIDVPSNTSVLLMESQILKKSLRANKISADLIEIAKNIDEEDNGVVRIIKFK